MSSAQPDLEKKLAGSGRLLPSLKLLYVYALATGAILTFMAYWDGMFLSSAGPLTGLGFGVMTILVMPIAFVYCEFAAMVPKVGAEVVYNTVGLNKHEEAFRRGRVSAELYGYLKIPFEATMVQGIKAGGKESERVGLENAVFHVLDLMAKQKDTQFLIGPGTTTREIKARLGSGGTLLGVDVAQDGRLIAEDVNEAQILEMIQGKKAKIVVTIIGGQGYIFGRGNQQLSPRVIKEVGKENIVVVASKNKLAALQARPLLVDTGDDQTNQTLTGYVKVVTGYNQHVMCRVWS